MISLSEKPVQPRKLLTDFWLLGLWIVLGTLIRVLRLTSKPPWTDEFATMVFSLGNNFDTIPLNQIISIETLLQPLQINPGATLGDVFGLLLREDNHPPLYFLLAHLWIQGFPSEDGYVSLWGMRSLAVFFGILAIPSSYFLGKIVFNSRLVGQLSAAMMAFSPYAVFIAQESRHYTLGVLFVIASLSYFLLITKSIIRQKSVANRLIFGWLIINCLGLLTHYFFVLTILSESIILLIIFLYQIQQKTIRYSHWLPIGGILGGTASLFWVWFVWVVPKDYGHQMTEWIQRDNSNFLALISPIFQLLGTLITMMALLPVESEQLSIVLISGFIMILFFLWVIAKFKAIWPAIDSTELRVVIGFVFSTIALFFFITYILSMDITRGARYNFVYFPAVILILGVWLANGWRRNWKHFVVIVLGMALMSSISVTFNLGYRKYYRPDRLVTTIQETLHHPVIIATTYKSLVQIGEMMGIAREFQQRFPQQKPRFLFVSGQTNPQILLPHNEPFDLWLVNFQTPLDLSSCGTATLNVSSIAGYEYRKFSCGG